MPKRTNVFQKLIFLINKQIAGKAEVIESALLPDAVTGKKREVDIIIETKACGYKTTFAIECVDWKRKAGENWIENMFQKHQHLPTDKLVLVSASGFTTNAYRKAQFYHIDALSLDKALESDWLKQLKSIEMVVWNLEIVKNEIQLIDSVENAKIEVPIRFCDPAGKQHALLQSLRSDIVSNLEIAKILLETLSKSKHTTKLLLVIDLQTGKFRDWYIPDSKGNQHKMKWYRMYVQISKARSIADVQRTRYKERNVAFSKLSFGKDNTVIAFIQGDKGEINICADVVSNKNKNGRTMYAQYIFTDKKSLLVHTVDTHTKKNEDYE